MMSLPDRCQARPESGSLSRYAFMKSELNPAPHRNLWLLVLAVFMLNGCATRDRPELEAGVNTLNLKPHQYTTNIKSDDKGGKGENDRFRLFPGTGVTVKQATPPPAA